MDSTEVAEIKCHFGLVAEGFEGQVRQVAEAVSALDAKFHLLREELREEFDATRTTIASASTLFQFPNP